MAVIDQVLWFMQVTKLTPQQKSQPIAPHHGYWCPGDLCHQYIDSHGINWRIKESSAPMWEDFNYPCHLNLEMIGKAGKHLFLFYATNSTSTPCWDKPVRPWPVNHNLGVLFPPHLFLLDCCCLLEGLLGDERVLLASLSVLCALWVLQWTIKWGLNLSLSGGWVCAASVALCALCSLSSAMDNKVRTTLIPVGSWHFINSLKENQWSRFDIPGQGQRALVVWIFKDPMQILEGPRVEIHNVFFLGGFSQAPSKISQEHHRIFMDLGPKALGPQEPWKYSKYKIYSLLNYTGVSKWIEISCL